MRHRKSMLQCPSCGHEQEEPPSALSTFCRSCGHHYKIENGRAVGSPPPAPFPFPLRRRSAHRVGSRSQPGVEQAARTKSNSASGRRETQLEFFAAPGHPAPNSEAPAPAPASPVATTSGDHPTLARMARRLSGPPKPGHRHVHCLACDFPQSIPLTALSTMCLRCTEPIPLIDYEIQTVHHRRIRTRGNVHVRRKGAIRGVTVQCNDLIIKGGFTGTRIDCDGELVLLRDATIDCPIRCRRLVVRGGIDITFTEPVHAQEAVIDGVVKGDLICERKLHLDSHSILEGDIQTRALSISEGARHRGVVSMPQLEERYAKFGELDEESGRRTADPRPPASGPPATEGELSLRPAHP